MDRPSSAPDPQTKCELARLLMSADYDTKCTPKKGGPPPAPVCALISLMNTRAYLRQLSYSPSSLFTASIVHDGEVRNTEAAIADRLATLKAAFPNSPPEIFDIEWDDLQECLWNEDGTPGGPLQHKYFGRLDLLGAGYEPRPLLGGDFLSGAIPVSYTQYVPIWTDTFLNPTLLIVVLLLLYVIVLALVLRRTERRTQKGAPRSALRTQWGTH